MVCYQYPYQIASIAEACKRTARKSIVDTMYKQGFVILLLLRYGCNGRTRLTAVGKRPKKSSYIAFWTS